jgi:Protein of unknown function (DUF3592)
MAAMRAAGRSPSILMKIAAVGGLVIGLWMAVQMASTAFDIVRMSGWPEVAATLDHVELLSTGSRTHAVEARYHYEVAGRTYTGTQVSVYHPDNLNGFFERTFADLHDRMERRATVPAHVNPAAPNEAVLLPVWRGEVFLFQFALMLGFGGFGFFVLRRGRGAQLETPRSTPPAVVVKKRRPSVRVAPVTETGGTAGRRSFGPVWILIGVAVLAIDFILMESSRGDSYTVIDRLMADQVTATGSIFVSPPDARVPALFEEMRAAQGTAAALVVKRSASQLTDYKVSLTAPDRASALAAMDRLLSSVHDAYRVRTGRDATVFADAYVAPVVTEEHRRFRQIVTLGPLVLGLLACAVGTLMLIRARRAS